jgi:hypothetical protein
MEDKATSGKPTGQPIDYRTADDFVVRYANNTYFEPSLWDLKLIFGQSDQKAGMNVINQHTSITLPWSQVKVVLYFLTSQLAAFEALNGRIQIHTGIIPPVADHGPKDIPGVPQAKSEEIWQFIHET